MNKETQRIVDTLTGVTWRLNRPAFVEVIRTRGHKDTVRVVRGAYVLCSVQDRVLHGEATRDNIPIITGHEWVSLERGGWSYPDVGGGPFVGRGWCARLGREALRYLTREVSS